VVRIVCVLSLHFFDASARIVTNNKIAEAAHRSLNDDHSLWINRLISISVMKGQCVQLVAFRHQLHFLSNSDDTTARLRLDILLRNVLTLVVEEAVRIAGPCDATHVDFWHNNRLTFQ
jgi:hypothetical protein